MGGFVLVYIRAPYSNKNTVVMVQEWAISPVAPNRDPGIRFIWKLHRELVLQISKAMVAH